jgi:hypothetical protein
LYGIIKKIYIFNLKPIPTIDNDSGILNDQKLYENFV